MHNHTYSVITKKKIEIEVYKKHENKQGTKQTFILSMIL